MFQECSGAKRQGCLNSLEHFGLAAVPALHSQLIGFGMFRA